MTKASRSQIVFIGLFAAIFGAACVPPGDDTPRPPVNNPGITNALREGFTRGAELAHRTPSVEATACDTQSYPSEAITYASAEIAADVRTARLAGCYIGFGSYDAGRMAAQEGHTDASYCETYADTKIAPIVQAYTDRAMTAAERTLVVTTCRQGFEDAHH